MDLKWRPSDHEDSVLTQQLEVSTLIYVEHFYSGRISSTEYIGDDSRKTSAAGIQEINSPVAFEGIHNASFSAVLPNLVLRDP